MNGNDENFDGARKLTNLPAQSVNPAFDRREMLTCAACRRTNPPTRARCFYCAAELENDGRHLRHRKLTVRKPENWEKGFNLVCAGKSADEIDFARAAEAFEAELETIRNIVESGKKLPLLRVETEREAQIVGENLRLSGIETEIVSDSVLAADKLPKRLRGLELADDKVILIHFNNDEISEIAREDLILIVKGTIFERKIEAVEQRKKGEVKIVEQFDTAKDEVLFDVYSRRDADGFRIYAKGFDFSCLGKQKGWLAAENLQTLLQRLSEFAPHSTLIDDYLSVREMLGKVWEVEHRSDPKGLKHQGFSKYNFAKVETSSNLQQFTKYSRLQKMLIKQD